MSTEERTNLPGYADRIVRSANTAASLGRVRDALERLASAVETEYPNDVSLAALLRALAVRQPNRSHVLQQAVRHATGGQSVLAAQATAKGEKS
jgi:hypothetical protein